MERIINGRSIKILIVTCTYPHNSSLSDGTFVANWASQLYSEGFNIKVYKRDHITFGSYLKSLKRVITFYRKPRIFKYEWQGITVYRQGIHLRLPLDYSKSAPRITYKEMRPIIEKIYKEYNFDLIYIATWGDLSLAMSWIAKELKIPYIASAIGDHTNLYYDKPDSIYYKYHREIFMGAEFVICVSEDLNRKVKTMTEDKVDAFTYYSGVDTEKFKPSYIVRNEYRKCFGYDEKDFLILFVGRLTKSKGIYELLNALRMLLNKDLSFKLLLVGPILENAKINKTIKILGVDSNIKFTGGVGHEEIKGYMNAADVFVLPSWMEGLPNVAMEACACELPVIASAVGGIPEIIDDKENGLLIRTQSVGDLFEQLRYVKDNPDIVKSMGENARKKMINKFNYSQNGKLLKNRIEEIFVRHNNKKIKANDLSNFHS